MKILVTGGLGAVGAPLARELRQRGHAVWVCDLPHAEGPNYIRCDVGDYRQVQRVFDRTEFEFVYHAAAEFGRWNGEDYYEKVWQKRTPLAPRTSCVFKKHANSAWCSLVRPKSMAIGMT